MSPPRPFPWPLLLAGALLASPARADDDADRAAGRVLYQNGATLYEEGQYERAIEAWEAAYALTREPDLLYNIANALERLGRLREAIDKLNEFRVYAPEDARLTTERRLRALEDRLAAEQAAAPTPAPAPTPTPAPTSTDRHTLRTAGIVLSGLGAGSAAAASGLYATASQRAATARQSCVDAGADLLCTADAEQPAAQSRSLAAGGHASWVITGALLATGVTLIALDRNSDRVAILPTLLPGPSGLVPGGAGLVLHVSL
jgi:tetratricopeptide (TPR) repeat protein